MQNNNMMTPGYWVMSSEIFTEHLIITISLSGWEYLKFSNKTILIISFCRDSYRKKSKIAYLDWTR